MTLPVVKLTEGLHVLHLFYNIDREAWASLTPEESIAVRDRLTALLNSNFNPCHPRITSFVTVGGKADIAFMLIASELGEASRLHREIEALFPPGTLQRVYTYFSVTELSEYSTTDEDNTQMLVQTEKLTPGTEEFEARMNELKKRRQEYEHYRLNPELPDWEVMGFYPMSKRRSGADNWYTLDFATRKKLMAGHARVGRRFAGKISQLITGSTGLDDWEWGVTLMSHQVDSLKDIVYQMRFDEVTSRYGEFGPFYINLRLQPSEIWEHLQLLSPS